VHGGARLPLLHDQAEPEPQQKALLQPGEKHAIARAAADLVVPGTAVGIGSGTTTLELARVLAERDDLDGLTIVTNALAVAEVLDGVGGVTVVLIGGVRTISGALVGPIATSGIRQLNLHTLVIGCHGIDPERGATAPNLLEAETNRAFMAQAATTVVLADATKWGIAGLATFAAFDEIDVLVTDESLADAHRHDLAEHVRRADVVVAAVGSRHLLRPDWIAPGAAVLDVGITRERVLANGRARLAGDVHPGVAAVAGWLSPVPGGVGPMTRVMLLDNVVRAAEGALG